jgi:hypothetical protein
LWSTGTKEATIMRKPVKNEDEYEDDDEDDFSKAEY